MFQVEAFAARRDKLNKADFRAFQASRRGGEILCQLIGDRVELEGSCVFYMEGRWNFERPSGVLPLRRGSVQGRLGDR
jgi:hypothetical protein